MSSEGNESIGFSISHTANLLNSSMNKKLVPYKIAIEQRAILEIIKKENSIRQSDLGNILKKDRTTISRTLKTLETKAYIIKEMIDNKTFVIKLSKLGEKVMNESEEIVANFRKNLLEELTQEEIDNLYKCLNKINSLIKE
jgi:DNA-binding MarR family transcriptional regulator